MSALTNREFKEYEKLSRKAGYAKLSDTEQRRLEKLEGMRNIEVSTYVAKNSNEKYRLGDFKPRGKQQLLVNEIDRYQGVVVQGSSGVGKTSCVVWKGLSLLGTKYKHIVFIKNPTEAGDDQIGFLTGDAESKLQAHFDSMRGVFLNFMSKEKLASDEKNGNIKFSIPNFMLGCTISSSYVILDESQTYSPSTMKLLLERIDDTCCVCILGDKQQTYSVKKRKDGFTDFIHKITDVEVVDGKEVRYSVEPLFTYIELTSSENQRGELSKRITELYSG